MLTDAEWAKLGRQMKLTRRELQVLRGVINELTDDAIAAELGISTRTVRAHLEKIYRKCQCRTRCGAVVSVLRVYIGTSPRS